MPSRYRSFPSVYDHFGLFSAIFGDFFGHFERSQTNLTGRQGEPMLSPSLKYPGDSIPSHLRSSPIVYDRFRLFWAIFGSFFGYFERSQTNMEGSIDEPILGPRLR